MFDDPHQRAGYLPHSSSHPELCSAGRNDWSQNRELQQSSHIAVPPGDWNCGIRRVASAPSITKDMLYQKSQFHPQNTMELNEQRKPKTKRKTVRERKRTSASAKLNRKSKRKEMRPASETNSSSDLEGSVRSQNDKPYKRPPIRKPYKGKKQGPELSSLKRQNSLPNYPESMLHLNETSDFLLNGEYDEASYITFARRPQNFKLNNSPNHLYLQNNNGQLEFVDTPPIKFGTFPRTVPMGPPKPKNLFWKSFEYSPQNKSQINLSSDDIMIRTENLSGRDSDRSPNQFMYLPNAESSAYQEMDVHSEASFVPDHSFFQVNAYEGAASKGYFTLPKKFLPSDNKRSALREQHTRKVQVDKHHPRHPGIILKNDGHDQNQLLQINNRDKSEPGIMFNTNMAYNGWQNQNGEQNYTQNQTQKQAHCKTTRGSNSNTLIDKPKLAFSSELRSQMHIPFMNNYQTLPINFLKSLKQKFPSNAVFLDQNRRHETITKSKESSGNSTNICDTRGSNHRISYDNKPFSYTGPLHEQMVSKQDLGKYEHKDLNPAFHQKGHPQPNGNLSLSSYDTSLYQLTAGGNGQEDFSKLTSKEEYLKLTNRNSSHPPHFLGGGQSGHIHNKNSWLTTDNSSDQLYHYGPDKNGQLQSGRFCLTSDNSNDSRHPQQQGLGQRGKSTELSFGENIGKSHTNAMFSNHDLSHAEGPDYCTQGPVDGHSVRHSLDTASVIPSPSYITDPIHSDANAPRNATTDSHQTKDIQKSVTYMPYSDQKMDHLTVKENSGGIESSMYMKDLSNYFPSAVGANQNGDNLVQTSDLNDQVHPVQENRTGVFEPEYCHFNNSRLQGFKYNDDFIIISRPSVANEAPQDSSVHQSASSPDPRSESGVFKGALQNLDHRINVSSESHRYNGGDSFQNYTSPGMDVNTVGVDDMYDSIYNYMELNEQNNSDYGGHSYQSLNSTIVNSFNEKNSQSEGPSNHQHHKSNTSFEGEQVIDENLESARLNMKRNQPKDYDKLRILQESEKIYSSHANVLQVPKVNGNKIRLPIEIQEMRHTAENLKPVKQLVTLKGEGHTREKGVTNGPNNEVLDFVGKLDQLRHTGRLDNYGTHVDLGQESAQPSETRDLLPSHLQFSPITLIL